MQLCSSGFETNTRKPKVGQYEVFLNEFEKLALPVFDSVGKYVFIVCTLDNGLSIYSQSKW